MKVAAAEILLDSSKFFPYLHFILVYSVASFFGAVPKEKFNFQLHHSRAIKTNT